jgi:DNA-binding transcriptional LysR family regulator
MKAFIEVVENGGYSAAARKMGRSKALLSKYVRELEDELQALLINRTTRQLSLTEAGQAYFDSAQEILQRIEEAKENVRQSGSGVGGTLRVTAPRSLGPMGSVFPIVEFARTYPEIKLEVDFDDRVTDLVEERFDVAIRIGKLENSSLIAKRLGGNRLLYCASPKFLKQHGTPKAPKDLVNLPCIVDTNWRGKNNWPFTGADGQHFTQAVTSVLDVNDPEVCKRAALQGLGIAIIPEFVVSEEIKSGKLISVLDDYVAQGAGIYAVYPHRRHVPAKVRTFIDFMSERLNIAGLESGNTAPREKRE